MSTNVADIIGGPAIVQYGGASLYSKNDIKLIPTINPFDVVVDAHGIVSRRRSSTSLLARITPEGRWGNLSRLFPYANMRNGELITPTKTFGTVTAAADTVAIAGHRLVAGMAVRLTTSAADLPAGLDTATLYYIGVPDADTVTFHTTYADAIADTNLVDITDAGTGTHKLIVQEPLVITEINTGDIWTFHNAAITQLANITPAVDKTLFGELVFECFRKNNTAVTAANAIYTKSNAAFSYPSFDPDDILTQPYAAAWGAGGWASIESKDGWEISFPMTLEPVGNSNDGILTRRFKNVDAIAKAAPVGISRETLMSALKLQDTGADLGAAIESTDDLIISGTGVHITLYNAALMNGDQSFGSSTDGVEPLEWRANRSFTAGVPDPVFRVATAAP